MWSSRVEWELEGETEVLGENLFQCQFVHKSHMTLSGLKPGPPRSENGDYPPDQLHGPLLIITQIE
jgi:hypothetical protein